MRSFPQAHGEVLAELEVWGGEGLSVAELVCLLQEASSDTAAAAAGCGGQESRDDDKVPANDG